MSSQFLNLQPHILYLVFFAFFFSLAFALDFEALGFEVWDLGFWVFGLLGFWALGLLGSWAFDF